MGLYKRKGSQFYWMTFTINGQKNFESTGTSSKKLAERIHAKRVTEIVEGRWFEGQAKQRTLREMIGRFTEEQTVRKDYYQKARDLSIFRQFFRYFGAEATLKDIETTVGGYEQFRRASGKKPATIVKELGLLRRMYNVALKQWKWKITNPVSEIELPRVRNERVRYLSEEERLKLFKVLNQPDYVWLKPLVIIALDTGLRISNICNLQWPEVNIFSRTITISADKMKNDDYLGIPLTVRATETLRELQKVKCLTSHVFHDKGQPLYPVKVQRAFRKVVKAAGLDNFRFHDFRHCTASYLRQNGVDLHTISMILGHRDMRVTKRYAHLNVDSLRDSIAKLDTVTVWLQPEKEVAF